MGTGQVTLIWTWTWTVQIPRRHTTSITWRLDQHSQILCNPGASLAGCPLQYIALLRPKFEGTTGAAQQGMSCSLLASLHPPTDLSPGRWTIMPWLTGTMFVTVDCRRPSARAERKSLVRQEWFSTRSCAKACLLERRLPWSSLRQREHPVLSALSVT